MEIVGKCCKSCKLGKLRMKSLLGFEKSVVWCKKHRENFEVDSCCDSYEEKELLSCNNCNHHGEWSSTGNCIKCRGFDRYEKREAENENNN